MSDTKAVPKLSAHHLADQKFLREAFQRAFGMAPAGEADPLTATRRASLLAHIADNEAVLASLVSGEQDTYDTRTHRAVEVAEIERAKQQVDVHGEGTVRYVINYFNRWLTPPSEGGQP
jgi:hypothetical protein